MDSATRTRLLEINRQFYETFGAAFAATRRRIQPGVRRVLAALPPGGCWLDLGCGSGALAAEWARQGRTGCYWGVDFSAALLNEAQAAVAGLTPPGLTLGFQPVNLGDPHWATALPDQRWDGVLCFAALHHLPGAAERLALLQQVRALLPPGGWFIHSEWQFQHSPRLLARVQPWEQVGLRYVHCFSPAELADLAAQAGFTITETFESDGQGGRLAIYQQWQRES